MKYFKALPFLLLFILFAECNKEKDEYKEFRKVPEYITHPDREHKAYYEAYDKTLQRWGVAYEELYITTSKGIAHVLMSGPKNGESVVLLHGMSASSTMWYPNAKALAKQYRIFAIDLIIEPGKSYKTGNFENLDEVTAWYEEIFWALKLESFHLIGTSRGGWIAVNIALHSKRNIRSLILLSPVQTFIWIPPSIGLLKNIFNVFYSKEEGADRTMETLSKYPNKIDRNYIKQYRIGQENDTVNKFVTEMKPFSNKDLQSLKMPVLVLIGDDDIFNTKQTIRLTEKYIPRGKGEIIHNSGHFLSVDQAKIVNKKIIDFMKSTETGD
ncbi:MAG: alpha/beta hydrolase [Flavobacteriaceae bacterium]|nr:alpha/beta hydrolase [Flavobacteriaceae bacterium]